MIIRSQLEDSGCPYNAFGLPLWASGLPFAASGCPGGLTKRIKGHWMAALGLSESTLGDLVPLDGHLWPLNNKLEPFTGHLGLLSTVKPRYSLPAFNIIPPIVHANFGS